MHSNLCVFVVCMLGQPNVRMLDTGRAVKYEGDNLIFMLLCCMYLALKALFWGNGTPGWTFPAGRVQPNH